MVRTGRQTFFSIGIHVHCNCANHFSRTKFNNSTHKGYTQVTGKIRVKSMYKKLSNHTFHFHEETGNKQSSRRIYK